jgi:hypothetical protein
MSWQVEILNELVAAEIAPLPADIQARFLRLGDRIRLAGPAVTASPARSILPPAASGSSSSGRS